MSVKDSYYLPDDGYFIMEYPSLDIRTVALTLGHICRFAGDVKTFWPVLMHALVVSYLVPEPVAIHALLHDAGEIYIGGYTVPFKSPAIRDFEDSALRYIYRQFRLPFPSLDARIVIKAADIRTCTAEVWTVGPEYLKVLPKFQTRDLFAERIISEMLDGYDYGSVLNPDRKYVSFFLDLFSSLHP